MNFKIGGTSDVYPNDLITNVQGLKKIVDCIQLNLFKSSDFSLLPTRIDIQNLKEITAECGTEYTVHLPLDMNICSEDEAYRKESLQKIFYIYELTKEINPIGYIVHLERIDLLNEELWIDNTFDSLDKIYREIPKNKLLIENVSSYRSKFI
ncbi:MAG: cobamide remodeling phosphodiesterase CbiR, partial [Thermodesulfobacteriota bacterium]